MLRLYGRPASGMTTSLIEEGVFSLAIQYLKNTIVKFLKSRKSVRAVFSKFTSPLAYQVSKDSRKEVGRWENQR